MPNTQFRWVASISALQSESGMVNGEIAVVHGYYSAGDGGGGSFFFDTSVPGSSTITGATNAAPIKIRTSAAHGLNTGQTVVIAGVGGNTNANGTRKMTYVSDVEYTLDDSSGNGDYTSGGTVGDGGATIPSETASGRWRRMP